MPSEDRPVRAVLKFDEKEDFDYIASQIRTIRDSHKNIDEARKLIHWYDRDNDSAMRFANWVYKRFCKSRLDKPQLFLGSHDQSINMIIRKHKNKALLPKAK